MIECYFHFCQIMKGVVFENKNILRVQVGTKLIDKSLPPVHHALKVFDLLPGHWAYPGKGVLLSLQLWTND